MFWVAWQNARGHIPSRFACMRVLSIAFPFVERVDCMPKIPDQVEINLKIELETV